MRLDITSTVALSDGVAMPRIGLGVFKSEPGAETEHAVRWALEAGYRHIDTAALYANEASVGAGIRESGVDRKDVFVTTKVWNTDQGYDNTMRAFDRSLGEMGFGYVDLYLVHWPVPSLGLAADTWRALEVLQREGRARAIGDNRGRQKARGTFPARRIKEVMVQAIAVKGGSAAARRRHRPIRQVQNGDILRG